ncbi:ABC transporter ATP-binding protein [Listeria aquatica]|uniref:ABC transporter ATP-binding protein n=2 Tax=Listeria aquatica TaxID=1494960 RepID=UPI0031F5BAF3
MGLTKLFAFYHKKLGNWNLIFSFMKGFWVGYFVLLMLLFLGTVAVFYLLSSGVVWFVLLLDAILAILFFYLLIHLRAKRLIRVKFQLRSFKELQKMKDYLFYGYLAKNGFETRAELSELILFIRSEAKTGAMDKKKSVMGLIFKIFIAVFLAIYGGSFLFALDKSWNRLLAVLVILLAATLFFYLVLLLERAMRYLFGRDMRQAEQMVQTVIYIQTVLRARENTDYDPFRIVEKKVQENPFLQEIIDSKSFL